LAISFRSHLERAVLKQCWFPLPDEMGKRWIPGKDFTSLLDCLRTPLRLPDADFAAMPTLGE